MSAGGTKTLYTLRLAEGKLYVGITNDLSRREKEHSDSPSGWVLRYRVSAPQLKVVEANISQRYAAGAEDRSTAELMWNLGVNAVRGGSLSVARDYQLFDARQVAWFISHNLQLDFDMVLGRVLGELAQTSSSLPAAGLGLCVDCLRPSFHGQPRCGPCYYSVRCCGNCGERGHGARWCPLAPQSPHSPPSIANTQSEPESQSDDNGTDEDVFLVAAAESIELISILEDDNAAEPPTPPPAPLVYRMIEEAEPRPCTFCGQLGHSPEQCAHSHPPANPGAQRGLFRERRRRYSTPGVCFTCGREAWPYGHLASECNELADVDGRPIPARA